jgi:hypothetical protein
MKISAFLATIILAQITLTATPDTFSTTTDLVHNCNLSGPLADVTEGGTYLCITDGDDPTLKSSEGSSITALLSKYSPPKSTTEAKPFGIACYKNSNKCVVFWANHFE